MHSFNIHYSRLRPFSYPCVLNLSLSHPFSAFYPFNKLQYRGMNNGRIYSFLIRESPFWNIPRAQNCHLAAIIYGSVHLRLSFISDIVLYQPVIEGYPPCLSSIPESLEYKGGRCVAEFAGLNPQKLVLALFRRSHLLRRGDHLELTDQQWLVTVCNWPMVSEAFRSAAPFIII